VQQALAWLSAPDSHLVTLADLDYPRNLLEIADPPPVIYLKGRRTQLGRAAIAIVGSRQATPQGLANAEAFAAELSRGGWSIVSGLALGIDAAAHRGALTGPGSTLAVVGTGLDLVYPARNLALAHEIAAQGALISEFPLGTPARAGHFPRRNRLISALSRGVLVVEAALGSGSLITAREAAEQGREVFAIPGSIHAPLARGCHRLIRDGAKLVESAQDILDELGPGPTPALHAPAAPASHAATPHDPLLRALGHDPIDLDTLCARSGLTVEEASAKLLALELDGQVARLPGGLYQRLV
jgi:DNA processing protein